MQLAKEQIENLYAFTKKHHVEWYDLQTELVDHLANDIENIWEKKPSLTFEQARYKATIKFGLRGFSNFVKQREKALRKKNWMLFRQFFKAYFKLPKLIITSFLIALVYLLLKLSPNKNTFLFTSLLVITTTAYLYAVTLSLKFKIRQKRSHKKWLFEDVISSSTPFFLLIIIFQPFHFYHLLNSDININWSFSVQLISSIFITLLAISFYVSLWVIPPKMKGAILENYEINNI